MFRKKNYLMTFLLGTALILTFVSLPAQASTSQASYFTIDSPRATISGTEYLLEVPPRVYRGTTMLPLRFTGETILQCDVYWNPTTRTALLEKGTTKIELVLNSRQARVNGQVVNLNSPPQLEKGRILVPLRFLAESFLWEVEYLPTERAVILWEPVEPTALFRFSTPQIIAGQEVEFIDESFDSAGRPLADRIWEINYNESLRSRDLNSLLLKPPAGTYVVRLKVKSKAGLWSEWFEQHMIVEPNRAPVVRDLQILPERPSMGESISFSYSYDNEEWEPVVEERWSYRWWSQDGENRSGVGRPRAFFEPGQYQINLSIRDAYGNWSDPKTVEIDILHREKQSELSYKFSDPQPGEIVHNPDRVNYNDYPLNPSYRMTKTGPTLLFSNSPETVPGPGILYQDEVSEPIRVVYHHRNGSSTPLRLAIMVENTGENVINLLRTKSASGGPVEDVMHLGQLVAFNYYNSAENTTVMLQPGEKYTLYQSPGHGWKYNQSLTGMFDFQTDGPVNVSILALPLGDSVSSYEELPIWPRDGRHARGTFPQADQEVQILIRGDKKEKIVLGKDGEGFESWLKGYDVLTGDEIINKGNYGAVYHLHFTSETKTGILFNPRGISFKGALQGSDGGLYNIPATGSFSGLREAAVAGILHPGQKASLVYTPPNGSDAPVILAIIPESFWDE